MSRQNKPLLSRAHKLRKKAQSNSSKIIVKQKSKKKCRKEGPPNNRVKRLQLKGSNKKIKIRDITRTWPTKRRCKKRRGEAIGQLLRVSREVPS